MNKTESQEVPTRKEVATGQEVPKEEGVSNGKEITPEEFERIYNLFHDDPGNSFNEKVMAEFEQVLADNDIGDYRVAMVTFVPRNPTRCRVYLYECGNGRVCLGWTCK